MEHSTVSISLGDLSCSPQETVLVQRYGRASEETGNVRADTQAYYRFIGAIANEIRTNFTVKTPTLMLDIKVRRFYLIKDDDADDACQYICRVMQTDAKGLDVRKKELKESEVFPLEVLYTLMHSRLAQTGSAPLGIRHFLWVRDPHKKKMVDNLVTEITPPDDVRMLEIRRELSAYARELRAAMETPDEQLPECNPDQQWVGKSNLPRKCLEVCRARHHCCQRSRFLFRAGEALERVTIEGRDIAGS